jgi:hypothetical protein
MESTPIATQSELLALLNTRQFYGHGCGYVGLSLLASALLREKHAFGRSTKDLNNLQSSQSGPSANGCIHDLYRELLAHLL